MAKIFSWKGEKLTPQEIADWANKVHRFVGGKGNPFTKEDYIPHDGRTLSGSVYRLKGCMCDCGYSREPGEPSLGEFDLLPYSDPLIREGGKAYMKCRKCGCISHL